MEVSDVKACRLCLISDVRMFVINSSSEHCLKSFLGQNISYTSGLPRYTCYECTALLSKIKKFKTKCLVAQTVLYNLVKHNKVVTATQIKNIDRRKMNLQSKFSIHPNEITSIHPNEECSTIERFKDIDEVLVNEKICDLEVECIKTEVLDYGDVFTNETYSDNDNFMMEFVDSNVDHLQEQTNKYVTKNGRRVKPVKQRLMCNKEREKKKKSSINGHKKKLKVVKKRKKSSCTETKIMEEDLEKDFIITLLSLDEQRSELEKRKLTDNYRHAEFKCELCYKDFPDEENLKSHMQYHNPEFGEFECSVCRLRARTAAALARHQSAHRARLRCRRAGDTAPRDQARNHLEWHDGVMPKYECDYCGTTICFRVLSTLQVHIGVEHSLKIETTPRKPEKRDDEDTSSEESEIGNAELHCKKCDIQFSNNRSLQRHRANSSKHNGKLHQRKRPLKRYSEEALALAVEAIRAGMPRQAAATAFGVPYSTLGHYTRDPSRSCRRPGPPPMLTGEEEHSLAQWIVKLKPKKSELKNKVLDMLKGDERLNRFTVSQKWMKLFINRHPNTKHVLARQF